VREIRSGKLVFPFGKIKNARKIEQIYFFGDFEMELQTSRLIREISEEEDIAMTEQCLAKLADANDVRLNEDWYDALGIGPESGLWLEHPYNELLKAIAYDLRAAAFQNAMSRFNYLDENYVSNTFFENVVGSKNEKSRMWETRARELGWKEEEE
jgi:hypothetical protein